MDLQKNTAEVRAFQQKPDWHGRSGRNRLKSKKYQDETRRLLARNPKIVQNPRKNQDYSKNAKKTNEKHPKSTKYKEKINFLPGAQPLREQKKREKNWSKSAHCSQRRMTAALGGSLGSYFVFGSPGVPWDPLGSLPSPGFPRVLWSLLCFPGS